MAGTSCDDVEPVPTTATRMDKFTEMMLSETGLISMIGKAERGPTAIEAIRRHKSAYLMAVGGAAYLVSKAIKAAKASLLDLYQDTEIRDLLLEEVEKTEDEKQWKITLGFSVPQLESLIPPERSYIERFGGALAPRYDRIYKLFVIDAEDGEVKSMKVRSI